MKTCCQFDQTFNVNMVPFAWLRFDWPILITNSIPWEIWRWSASWGQCLVWLSDGMHHLNIKILSQMAPPTLVRTYPWFYLSSPWTFWQLGRGHLSCMLISSPSVESSGYLGLIKIKLLLSLKLLVVSKASSSWSRILCFSSVVIWVAKKTLKDVIWTSRGRAPSAPYTNENCITFVAALTILRYAHKHSRNLSSQLPLSWEMNFLRVFTMVFLNASAKPFSGR